MKVVPNGKKEVSWDPFVLQLRFQVPLGKYVPKAPQGYLSEKSALSSVSGWGLFHKCAFKNEPDMYLLEVETWPRWLLGSWAIYNAVWLEKDGRGNVACIEGR